MTEDVAGDAGRPPSGGPAGPRHRDERRDRIGWGRACLAGVAIVAVGFAGVVWLPDLLLKELASMSRDVRVAIATMASFVALLVSARALRRLQARGVI